MNNGLMNHYAPPSTAAARWRTAVCDAPYLRGTTDAFVQIVRTEGVRSLYNGLPPTLAMAVPATMLYFTAYDRIRSSLELHSQGQRWGVFAPVISGCSARLLATTLISPIELVRTIMMAESGGGGGTAGTIMRVVAEVRVTGPRLLFRGLMPSLSRDVPFSAVYWLGYEQLRARLLAQMGELHHGSHDLRTTFKVSFVSGACSGAVAATLTTPFDVIKTRQQAFLFNRSATVPSTLLTGRQIIGEAGARGLFAGLGPRLAKVSPACAIMIGSYEAGKTYFAARNRELR
jgi:solute carrier family 25 protein 39/40